MQTLVQEAAMMRQGSGTGERREQEEPNEEYIPHKPQNVVMAMRPHFELAQLHPSISVGSFFSLFNPSR